MSLSLRSHLVFMFQDLGALSEACEHVDAEETFP